MGECSGSFKDWNSFGIPHKQMTVLLDISDKDPLHSHCYPHHLEQAELRISGLKS